MDLTTWIIATYVLVIISDAFLLFVLKKMAETIDKQSDLITSLRYDVIDLENNVKRLNAGVFKV